MRAGYETYLTEGKRILDRAEAIAGLGIRVSTVSVFLCEIETPYSKWTPREEPQNTPLGLSRTDDEEGC